MKQELTPGPKANQICVVEVLTFKLGLCITENVFISMIDISPSWVFKARLDVFLKYNLVSNTSYCPQSEITVVSLYESNVWPALYTDLCVLKNIDLLCKKGIQVEFMDKDCIYSFISSFKKTAK